MSYRKQFPKEDDKTVLSKLLIGTDVSKDRSALEKLLNQHIFDDFKTGKTVTAAGWILSVTEARQCALYSILNA